MEQLLPLVTVIIPTRNEEVFIERCLTAVLNQDYPADKLEIIIADGMSDDQTRAIVRQIAPHVIIIDNPQLIQAAGLNRAIEAATGDIIIRVDGHSIIAADYVRQCVAILEKTQAQNVGGGMDPVGITPMGTAIAIAGKSRFAVPTAFHVSTTAQNTDTVYLGTWQRETLQKLGGYNEQLVANEDYELNYRLRQQGGKIYFSPQIKSVYYGRQTLSGLAHQHFRYGRYKVAMLRLHPQSLRLRQIVAPMFVAVLLGSAMVGVFVPMILYLWLAVIALYTAVNLLFSVRLVFEYRQKNKNGWQHLARLPAVFTVIHLSWGMGFWVGLFRK